VKEILDWFQSYKKVILFPGLFLLGGIIARSFGNKLEISKLIEATKDLGGLTWGIAAISGLFVWLILTSNTIYLTSQKDSYKERFEDLRTYNKDTIQREVKVVLSEQLKAEFTEIVNQAVNPVNSRLDGIDTRLDGIESTINTEIPQIKSQLVKIESRLDNIEEHLTTED
jgi:tetrahydromethanopterin S-methyltransferase subunit G